MKTSKNFLKYHPTVFKIIIIVMGLYIWQNRQAKLVGDDTQAPADSTSYQLLNETCNGDECLLSSPRDMIGLSNISGYYVVESRSAWGSTEDCDSFVITGGSKKVIDYFSDLVAKGNTVNGVNELGQPIINLNLENFEQTAKQKLLSSTKDNTIDLSVFFPLWPHTEAGACFSFIEVLGIR